MELKNISNEELTLRVEKLVRSERKLTHIILAHIVEIESRRIYAELGFDGMFSYLTKSLGYSESAAYRRLQTARLLKSAPTIAEKLEQGSLNLSQLTQVQKCLKLQGLSVRSDVKKLDIEITKVTKSTSLEVILAKIENKNTFETKKILAIEFDQPFQTQTILTPQKDESVRIELTFTKEQFELLQESKNLLSHTIHNNSLADVIEHLALKFNKSILGKNKNKNKNDLQKGDLSAFAKPTKMIQRFAATKMQRRKLSIKLKRQLMEVANHTCQYVNKGTGKKCESKYQLQVDHVHPLAKGGSNHKNNLQILCRTHNHFKGGE